MALRTNNTVPQWEADNKQPYDTASKGASALTAALVRNVRAEIAAWLGLHSAAVFNDYHKFFDTMDIEVLVHEAIKNNFPIAELTLALQQHLAPRVVQVAGVSSKPTAVFKSILAGCKFSKAFTAVYLQSSMIALNDEHKEANLGVFMDDTGMQYIAKHRKQIIGTIMPCMCTFQKYVKKTQPHRRLSSHVLTQNWRPLFM